VTPVWPPCSRSGTAPFAARDGYDVLGIPELREAVARRFARRGLPTSSEQILITSGAQHAIDLLTRLLIHPGEAVLLESPAYAGVIDRLRQSRAELVGLDISEASWDVERLAHLARRTRAKVAYLTPDFHNPTGHLMAQDVRENLAELAAPEKVTLVVDETNVELRVDEDLVLPAPPSALAPARSTVTVGSLSKCVWAGLRIGWIRAEPTTVQALANLKLTSTLSTPLLEQLAATRLLGGIFGEELRSGSPEATAALARQGRYQQIRENLRVKEVKISAHERFVVCHNPEAADRDAKVRARLTSTTPPGRRVSRPAAERRRHLRPLPRCRR
jgi:DNA-binding transcriptional MocR family regulator